MAKKNNTANESTVQTLASGDVKKFLDYDGLKEVLTKIVDPPVVKEDTYLLGVKDGKLCKITDSNVCKYEQLNLTLLGDMLCAIVQAISGKSIAYSLINSDNGVSSYTVDGETKTLSESEEVSGVCDSLSLDVYHNLKSVITIGKCATRMNASGNYTLKDVTVILPSNFEYDGDRMIIYFSWCENGVFTIIGGKLTAINGMFSTSTSTPYPDDDGTITINFYSDTSLIDDFSIMFFKIGGMRTLNLGDKFDTSNGTDFSSMFEGCCSLTSLNLGDKFDTSNGTDFSSMFWYMTELVTLHLGDKFDFGNITNTGIGRLFTGTTKLQNVTGTVSNLKVSVNFSDPPFTRESALVFINGLSDEPAENNPTLQLSSTTKALLTDDDIAIATNKGWTIA